MSLYANKNIAIA